MKAKTYIHPSAEVLELFAEGVFCLSGQNEQYVEEDIDWEEE